MSKLIDYEQRHAEYEARRNDAMDQWFSARPEIERTPREERIYEGGFRMAWENWDCVQEIYDNSNLKLVLDRDATITSLTQQLEAAQQELAALRGGVDIKAMVDRFLCWKLPQDFAPDGGISFVRQAPLFDGPIGTNLLTADQAKAMIEHICDYHTEKNPNAN